jgi:hypothetical protein
MFILIDVDLASGGQLSFQGVILLFEAAHDSLHFFVLLMKLIQDGFVLLAFLQSVLQFFPILADLI